MKVILAILCLFSVRSYAQQAEVWYTSNVATPDFFEMFTQPQRWATARARTDVLKVYQGQLMADHPNECPNCGENTFANFRSHGVFERLREWNMRLSIEGGTVKPGDCDALGAIANTKFVIDRLRSVNTRLDSMSLDEPFISGKEFCNNQDEVVTARYVKRYAEETRAYHSRFWPGHELGMGLIEAYPAFQMNEIQRFVQIFLQVGFKPTFLHLDIDRRAMKNQGIGDAKLKRDLLMISAYLKRQGIPLGIVFWGQDGNNKANNAKTVIDFAKQVKRTYGASEHIIMQSWEWADNDLSKRLLPDNLSENQNYTGTNLLLQTLKILGAR